MLNCFKESNQNAVPVTVLSEKTFSSWLATQPVNIVNLLTAQEFKAKPNQFCLWHDEAGYIKRVFIGASDVNTLWTYQYLPLTLPENSYYLENITDKSQLFNALMAWGIGAYQFTRYKNIDRKPAKLVIPETIDMSELENVVTAIHLAYDMINTPAEDMGPSQLAETISLIAQIYKADVSYIVGDDLLKHRLGGIYAVGKAAHQAPRLIDLRWGSKNHPKITLVGKGVCFDTGGLDIKTPGESMRWMKGDKGGAAQALALAKMIMKAKLPVCLRLLIPAVENSISDKSYRPSDVVTMYNGKTVEIISTDAEGRLILADALALASEEKPDLLIDFATLTAAATVALGVEIGALFSPQKKLLDDIFNMAEQAQDWLWPMPLNEVYRALLKSHIADMTNCASTRYGGAISAALFLKTFVPENINWVHLDVTTWYEDNRPGLPQGAKDNGLRAMWSYLKNRFGVKS
jgi:leucyl aminopeptidase